MPRGNADISRFTSIMKAKESEMRLNRFKLLVGQPFEGCVSTFELEKGQKNVESCQQLHRMPYLNAAEVEDLVGKWLDT
ncbi:uncharacterized protein PHALS_06529 [Plasmopara halstedii]|uniref:Uncharacterized protein n=1 Tax=Plasmopara halstedii TaxID=4781 RepID=A0A0P1B486_PLAHL|nr:uncharacterized protein PHALS_06529 [Plasmopara halstedii]CEG48717.1 hypothetical protein PHALS_06529 [Plasmopara halstedii]|eukprot:XP_024585086.1 hypothetical protein PHALS_06529 [Plasmopara halstedii]